MTDDRPYLYRISGGLVTLSTDRIARFNVQSVVGLQDYNGPCWQEWVTPMYMDEEPLNLSTERFTVLALNELGHLVKSNRLFSADDAKFLLPVACVRHPNHRNIAEIVNTAIEGHWVKL